MVVGLTVAITFKRLFMRLVISQSPVKYLPLSLVTKLSDCLVCMLLSDANPDLISHQFLSEKLLGYRLSLIEEVHHRQIQMGICQSFENMMAKRLQNDWKPFLITYFLTRHIQPLKKIGYLLHQNLIPLVLLPFPETFDLHQESATVLRELFAFYLQNLIDSFLKSWYSEGQLSELWPFRKNLPDLQFLQFLEGKITNPPVVFLFLSLVRIVTSYSSPIFEFLDFCDVCNVAEVPIVENDHMVVFREKDIKFDKITFEERSFDAFESVLREDAAITTMGDDDRFLSRPHIYIFQNTQERQF